MKKIIFILIILALTSSGLVFAQLNEERDEIAEIMPPFEFIYPKSGMKLKEEVKIKGRVEDAISVEFYYRPPQAIFSVYLAKGLKKGKDLWEYSWNTNLTPNGEYFLYAKIENQYGQYKSEKIEISIENEIERDQDKEKKIKKEIEKAKEEIEEKKEAIDEIKEEAKKDIKKELKEITEETELLTKEAVKEITEKTKKEEKIKKEIEAKENKKGKVKKEIEKIQEEVQALPERPIEIIKKDKEKRLEKAQAKKEKLKEELKSHQVELEDSKEKKEELKKKIIEKVREEEREKVEEKLQELKISVSEKEKIKIEKKAILIRDPDNDGLSDEEEIRLGADPFNPDSDNDGFLDGMEILAGYDPLKPGPAAKIIYQDPRKVPPKKADIYKVERVEVVILAPGEFGLKFIGRGLPNSFVTLYIFSLPIVVVVVKTDGNGYWEYILDKPLADGEHTVYVTVTNNHGQIETRSEAFVFRKIGETVFRIFGEVEAGVSPIEALQRSFAILVILVIILALGIALISISILTKRKEEI